MKEKIILKSANPQEYGDLVIECRVIENDQIGKYLESIPEERKFVAYKSGSVEARQGIPGEIIKTVLKTEVDGKEYILSEEENEVKERDGEVDIVVTNISSTSNEQYVVKRKKFLETYSLPEEATEENRFGLGWVPVYDPRVLTQIDENIIIITAWGSKAVCLKGGYIVTYNAEENDYNTLEKGAGNSTYKRDSQSTKQKKRN